MQNEEIWAHTPQLLDEATSVLKEWCAEMNEVAERHLYDASLLFVKLMTRHFRARSRNEEDMYEEDMLMTRHSSCHFRA